MWGKKEWQQHIFFSVCNQTTWGSRSKYFIMLYHSHPISLQSLTLCPLFTHIYSRDTFAFGTNSAIYGFFFRWFHLGIPLYNTDSQTAGLKNPKNLRNSTNGEHTCPSPLSKTDHKQKRVFLFQHRFGGEKVKADLPSISKNLYFFDVTRKTQRL